jgi:hypothetical protein
MLVQNPVTTSTEVVQPSTAKGQVSSLLDAGKQRSMFDAFKSSSSSTVVPVKDIWRRGHGLQTYDVPLIDDATSCCLKTAN